MKAAIRFAALPFLLSAGMLAGAAQAADGPERDKKFFKTVEGEWTGPGEIIAGKYKDTKFVCTFTGSTPEVKAGMTLDGGCRVGMFNQKMSATVEHAGREGYRGRFLDGAGGKGLDIVSGNVINGRKVVFAINRKALKGAMIARMADDNTMTVTVSVRVDDRMVPVIGMNLKRVDMVETGSVAQQ